MSFFPPLSQRQLESRIMSSPLDCVPVSSWQDVTFSPYARGLRLRYPTSTGDEWGGGEVMPMVDIYIINLMIKKRKEKKNKN